MASGQFANSRWRSWSGTCFFAHYSCLFGFSGNTVSLQDKISANCELPGCPYLTEHLQKWSSSFGETPDPLPQKQSFWDRPGIQLDHAAFDTRHQCFSAGVLFGCNVPQGSVLGPVLFVSYTEDVTSIFDSHQVSRLLYADVKQAYVSVPVYNVSLARQTLLY